MCIISYLRKEKFPVLPIWTKNFTLQQEFSNITYEMSWEKLIVYVPWYDTDRTENDVSNNLSTVGCLLFAAMTFYRAVV
jgi:hypothetical protein